MDYILGIDIGGTRLRLGLVNKDYKLSKFEEQSAQVLFDTDDPVLVLSEVICDYLSRQQAKVQAVAIGFPSSIDKTQTVILSTPNIPSLQGIPIVSLLSKLIGTPIYINRDVNYLMYHDIACLKLSQTGVQLGFYFGTGIGNAIFINGEPLKGKTGVTAELGHIPVIGCDRYCGCGNIGCLENHVSGWRLQQLRERYFSDCPIADVFSQHKAHQVLKEFVENMAIAIALEASLLDPEYIILGGGIIQMNDFPKTYLEKRITSRTRQPLPANSLQFIYATDGQANGVIGAGISGFEQLKNISR